MTVLLNATHGIIHKTHLVASVGFWGSLGSVHHTEFEWSLGEDAGIFVPGEETRPHGSIEWA